MGHSTVHMHLQVQYCKINRNNLYKNEKNTVEPNFMYIHRFSTVTVRCASPLPLNTGYRAVSTDVINIASLRVELTKFELLNACYVINPGSEHLT